MTPKAHALFCSILYIFAVNINGDESITQRYESNGMKSWKTRINWVCYSIKFNFSSSQSFARRQCVNILSIDSSVLQSAANQIAPINKDSKNSNSKSLKQHTLAKSISSCCFSAREIDRFIILICRYLSHQFDKIFNKVLIKILILVTYIYFSFSRTFSAFEFISSRLSHLLWNFLSQSWSDWYLSHRRWIFSQCRSIEEVNIRFETKFEREKKIVLRACLERSFDKLLSYQREIIWELMRFRILAFTIYFWHSISHVHICSLNQIFSLCYLFSRHASYNDYHNQNFALLFEIWLSELFHFATSNNLIVNIAISTVHCVEIQNLNWKRQRIDRLLKHHIHCCEFSDQRVLTMS